MQKLRMKVLEVQAAPKKNTAHRDHVARFIDGKDISVSAPECLLRRGDLRFGLSCHQFEIY